jgi:hypothetical protein
MKKILCIFVGSFKRNRRLGRPASKGELASLEGESVGCWNVKGLKAYYVTDLCHNKMTPSNIESNHGMLACGLD